MRNTYGSILLTLQIALACNDKATPDTSAASLQVHSTVSNEAIIVDSVKALNERMINACNKADAELLIGCFSKSPETNFVTQNGQVIKSYDSLDAAFRQAYTSLAYQSIPVGELDVHVLSDNYAIGTAATEYTFTLKDSTRLGGPLAWTILYVKEPTGWKVLRGHQSVKLQETRQASKQE